MIASTSPDRVEACLACDGNCSACVTDLAVEWPPVDRDGLAAAEAGGLAFAGADAPRPEATVAETWRRHREWRTRDRNRARYGDGGLFDHLDHGDVA